MVKQIIKMLIAIISGIGGYFLCKYMIDATDIISSFEVKSSPYSQETMALAMSLIEVMPIVFGVVLSIQAFYTVGKDSKGEMVEIVDWGRYGDRIKLAYAAKFGGENKGFNEEVDARIRILVDTDKGWTRQLAKDWIYRMSKFTDLKWLKMKDNINKDAPVILEEQQINDTVNEEEVEV